MKLRVYDAFSKKRIIFIVLMILWMAVIFGLSARDADQSTKDSDFVGMVVGHVLHPDFDEWSTEDQTAYVEQVEYVVRKAAHATEYVVLGILCMGAAGIDWPMQKRGFLSWSVATVYATTDEFHQLFVPGRSGQLTDVCIDSLGSVVGIVVVILVLNVHKRWMTRGSDLQ